jgi:hypothetical protein
MKPATSLPPSTNLSTRPLATIDLRNRSHRQADAILRQKLIRSTPEKTTTPELTYKI